MKKLLFAITLPLTMVCCQSENEQEITQFEEPIYKCWFAGMSGTLFYGVGRSHTDDHKTYDGKVIYLNKTTSQNYHCFDSNKYSDQEMIDLVRSMYMK